MKVGWTRTNSPLVHPQIQAQAAISALSLSPLCTVRALRCIFHSIAYYLSSVGVQSLETLDSEKHGTRFRLPSV